MFLSTLQRDHYVLIFIAFGCVLREQLRQQFLGGSDARNSRPEPIERRAFVAT
jgi:hypothetical protein